MTYGAEYSYFNLLVIQGMNEKKERGEKIKTIYLFRAFTCSTKRKNKSKLIYNS